MKSSLVALATLLLSASAMAGDVDVGRRKATVCMACHGDARQPGYFYTLQLAGRRADLMAVKIYEYRGWKIFNPMMNLIAGTLSPADIADIATWYESLGKPAVTSPLFTIKGDEAVQADPVAVDAGPN